MNKDDALASVDALMETIRDFPDSARRAQAEQHLATAGMCIGYVFDESDQ